jgi:hypothetical protein
LKAFKHFNGDYVSDLWTCLAQEFFHSITGRMYSFAVFFFVNCVMQQLHKIGYIENRDGALLLEYNQNLFPRRN